MKAVLVLTVVASVATQYYHGRSQGIRGFRAPHGGGFVAPHGGGFVAPYGGGIGTPHGGGFVAPHGVGVRPISTVGGSYEPQVDYSTGGSDYHFSWRHDGGQKYDWEGANNYCSNLGHGWTGIAIETAQEDKFVDSTIAGDELKYIWTGGYLRGYQWTWPTGVPVTFTDWSYTGGDGRPQPDNREDGKEFCLAVLNHFYQDGIVWHDVACHHLKPIICERPRTYG